AREGEGAPPPRVVTGDRRRSSAELGLQAGRRRGALQRAVPERGRARRKHDEEGARPRFLQGDEGGGRIESADRAEVGKEQRAAGSEGVRDVGRAETERGLGERSTVG